jgi:1-acyl-sn-glycerol-3-phosphate acyltransferase
MTEPYVPQLNLVYPEKLDDRMIKFKAVHDITIDENYPFLDKSPKFKFMRNVIYTIIYTIGAFISPVRTGLKIEGRENLRKYKDLFKNGALTVCNHVYRWDFVFIVRAVRFHKLYFPVWKEQLKSKDRDLIRYAGGIPVPDEINLIKYFNKAFDEIHEMKTWIHVFPEGSRFDFFQPIRPFKKGAFTMAYRYDLPVIPLAFSYRKPCFPFTILNFLRTLIGEEKKPMVTLRMGEPILIDKNLPRKEAVTKLRKECHAAVVRLAGISENKYPAEGD